MCNFMLVLGVQYIVIQQSNTLQNDHPEKVSKLSLYKIISVIDCISSAVYYIPMTYLFYK